MPNSTEPPKQIACPARVEWYFKCESNSGTTPSFTVAEDEGKKLDRAVTQAVTKAAEQWVDDAKCDPCPGGGHCNQYAGPIKLYGDWSAEEVKGRTWKNPLYYGHAWAVAVVSVSCDCKGNPAPKEPKIGGTILSLAGKRTNSKK
jgi:hypothetical protein